MNILKVLIVPIIGVVLFSGCVGRNVNFKHPEKSMTEFDKDKLYCDYKATQVAPTAQWNDTYGIGLAVARQDLIIKCLQVEKGWEIDKSSVNRKLTVEERVKLRQEERKRKREERKEKLN